MEIVLSKLYETIDLSSTRCRTSVEYINYILRPCHCSELTYEGRANHNDGVADALVDIMETLKKVSESCFVHGRTHTEISDVVALEYPDSRAYENAGEAREL